MNNYLSSGDSSQCVNKLEFQLFGGHLVNILAALLHHLSDSRFQLTSALGQGHDVFVEQVPLLGVEADLDNGLKNASSGDGVRSLPTSRNRLEAAQG